MVVCCWVVLYDVLCWYGVCVCVCYACTVWGAFMYVHRWCICMLLLYAYVYCCYGMHASV